MHGDKSLALVKALAAIPELSDIHIETNGAVDLQPFADLRDQIPEAKAKVRFIMDWKLPDSGEMDKMIPENLSLLDKHDELKFVIGSDHDLEIAFAVLDQYQPKALPLLSPVWETMPPAELVDKLLSSGRKNIKINMQLHKIIWDPNKRGV